MTNPLADLLPNEWLRDDRVGGQETRQVEFATRIISLVTFQAVALDQRKNLTLIALAPLPQGVGVLRP